MTTQETAAAIDAARTRLDTLRTAERRAHKALTDHLRVLESVRMDHLDLTEDYNAALRALQLAEQQFRRRDRAEPVKVSAAEMRAASGTGAP